MGMLKITIHDGAGELRLRLEGRLCGAWVGELRQCWQTAASITQGRNTILDLGEVDFIDSEGQALVSEMGRSGVQLVATTPLIQALVNQASDAAGCGTFETNALSRSAAAGREPRPV